MPEILITISELCMYVKFCETFLRMCWLELMFTFVLLDISRVSVFKDGVVLVAASLQIALSVYLKRVIFRLSDFLVIYWLQLLFESVSTL